MIKSRIAFNLNSPTSYPVQNPCSPINRPWLRFSPAEAFPHRLRRSQISFCAGKSVSSPHEDDFSRSEITVPPGGKSVDAVTLIGVATLLSKSLGLLREVTMASVFGVGPIATAFKYAWVLPGFSSSLLGGVNGPIHIIMSTTLSKLPKERGEKLFQHLTTIMVLVGGVVGALVYIFPEFIIRVYAPGLWILAEGQIIREIAIKQLKIMTPCIILAGPVGLGFGYMRGLNASSTGGNLVSYAASFGLFLQWIIQVYLILSVLPLYFRSLSNGKM